MTNGTNIKTTHYLDGFQYVNGDLSFFPHAEGYVRINGNPAKTKYWYDYVYNYTDHLGNIRLSYTKDRLTGELKVLEENHYYPFGLEHHNYNQAKYDISLVKDIDDTFVIAKNAVDYKYKYNGKEYQDELGLNWTAMDYRNYDMALGRFMNPDALSEFYFSHTPYNFSANNPVRISDPTGLVWYQDNETGEFVYYDGDKERDGFTLLGANYSYYTQGRWIDLRTEYDDDGNELYGAVDFYDQDGNYENSTFYYGLEDVVAIGIKSKSDSNEEWFSSQGAYDGAGDKNPFYDPNNTTFNNIELSIGASAFSKVVFEIIKENGLLEKENNSYGYYHHYLIVDQDSLKKLLSSSDFIKSLPTYNDSLYFEGTHNQHYKLDSLINAVDSISDNNYILHKGVPVLKYDYVPKFKK